MTFKALKILTSGLLIGDNKFNKDDNETAIGLLSLAFNMIQNKAESLHLMTKNQNEDILRTAAGDHLSRVPDLPQFDDDELDIDHELCFVAARYIASFLSKEKTFMHEKAAEDLIVQYNGKVNALLESIAIDEKGDAHVL